MKALTKPESLEKIAERIKLFHEVIDKGLKEIEKKQPTVFPPGPLKLAGELNVR